MKHVDLVEEAVLHETIAALLLEEWKNDMDREIDAINQILPTTRAGDADDFDDVGGKALEIRRWISSLLGKIARYKAQHRLLLNVAAIHSSILYQTISCSRMSYLSSSCGHSRLKERM
eukprot:scaffold4934_cov69-Skeletonema_marinoi.AAC.2